MKQTVEKMDREIYKDRRIGRQIDRQMDRQIYIDGRVDRQMNDR